MTYATDGALGIDVDAVFAGTGTSNDEEDQYTLGDKHNTPDGGEVIRVHAAAAIGQYDFVTIDENFEATALGDAGGEAGHILGVAQVAIADNEFAWVYLEGTNIKGNFLASCAADTEALFTNAEAGHLEDATSADAVLVVGIVAVTAAAGNNTNREIIMRSARFQS